MCNVVVSEDKPYPENADYYVQSAQNYSRRTDEYPYLMRFVNSDGREVTISFISYKSATIKDYITDETIATFTPTSTKSFIIGSLKDKSYVLIYYDLGVAMKVFFENGDYDKISFRNYNSVGIIGRYIDNERKLYYIYDYSKAPERRVMYYDARATSNFKNSFKYLPNDSIVITDNNGTAVYNKNLKDGIANKLFKVTLIKDGITTTDYYYVIDANNIKTKIGKIDGTYSCYDLYGYIIPESDLPTDAELEYEYTFNYDLPETETT